MNGGYRSAGRIIAIGLALVAYIVLSHYASVVATRDGGRLVALALVPYLVVAAVLAWRSRHRVAWLLVCAALAALAWWQLAAIGDHVAWVYLLQHVGGNVLLALVFGATLAANHVPLCTRIAALTHDPMIPSVARYTRQVTLAWTLFFAVNAGISLVLFAFAPVMTWSVYANLLNLPLVALMFAVEYAVRHCVLPDVSHVSIIEGVRRYIHLARTTTTPPA